MWLLALSYTEHGLTLVRVKNSDEDPAIPGRE